ncbi:MAG: HAD family phosphatase [Anaerolinea sp.]|nr:HAD family phosphatase [Anaerolinea sp.]
MKSIDAVIFDIGGVLWRSNGIPLSDKWAARCGLDTESFDRIVFASDWGQQALSGQITSDEKWKNIGSLLKLSANDILELRQDTWSGWWDTELFTYIHTLKPNYKLGIISDASSETREKVKEWINEDLFEVIVISAEEGVCKPNPLIYQIALQKLAVEAPASVFIDDRIKNIETAQSLGMKAIHYKEYAQMKLELDRYLE